MTSTETQPNDLSLSDWNWAQLMLHQALIGAISSNFRMIELAFEASNWVVRVTLGTDDPNDREEVEDACDQMGIYLMDVRHLISQKADAKVVAEIVISTAPIMLSPTSEPRVVFKMREEV